MMHPTATTIVMKINIHLAFLRTSLLSASVNCSSHFARFVLPSMIPPISFRQCRCLTQERCWVVQLKIEQIFPSSVCHFMFILLSVKLILLQLQIFPFLVSLRDMRNIHPDDLRYIFQSIQYYFLKLQLACIHQS